MLEAWAAALGDIIAGGGWLAPLLALLAGVLTSFLPCALSSVPLVIGAVGGGTGQQPKRALGLSLTFAAGMAVTFTAMGIGASLLGRLVGGAGGWWYIVLGVLMVLMALQTFGLFQFIPQSGAAAKHVRRGYLGALLAGVLGGFFSTPCATPVLVVLLGLVARGGSVLWGAFLLLVYAVGHSALVVVAGTSYSFVRRLTASGKYGRLSQILNYVLGAAILALALYMFYLGF